MAFSGDWRRLTGQPRNAFWFLGLAGLIFGFLVWRNVESAPVRAHISQGIELLQKGQKSAAEQQWREAVRLDAQNAQAWDLLGNLYLDSRDFEAANRAFQRVLQLNPDADNLQSHLAICALEIKNWSQARQFAQNQLAKKPDDVAALQVLAAVEKQDGKPQEQLKHLKRLVELQPKSAPALLSLFNELEAQGQSEGLIALAEQLVKLEPGSPQAHLRRGKMLFNASEDEKDMARAASDFQKVLELEPDNFEAHRFLARLYARQGQTRQAVIHFEAVGRGRPYASSHWLELSNAYRAAGNTRRAEELGVLFTRIKEFNRRTFELTKFLEANPDSASNHLQMGLLLMRGTKEESFYQLIRYRYANRQFESVHYHLDRAAQLQPQNVATQAAQKEMNVLYERHLKLGLQALKNNQIQTARNHLARAVLLRRDDARTQNALKQSLARGLDPFDDVTVNAEDAPKAQ